MSTIEQNHPPLGYAPGYDEAAAYGDPNASSFGITKITFDRLMKMENCDACIALYAFFCYTARWQNTDQAKCTVGYASRALGWSQSKTQRAKAQLVEAGLVENIKRVEQATGKVVGWFVRVRHVVRLRRHPDINDLVDFHPVTSDRVVHPVKKPGGGDLTPKCLRTGNGNASELVGDLPLNGSKGRKKFTPPSIKEVEARCIEIGLDKREAVKFFNWHDSRGWKVGRMPMVNWKSALNTWKAHHDDRKEQNSTSHTNSAAAPRGWDEWLKTKPQYQELCRGLPYRACRGFIQTEFIQDRKTLAQS